MFNSKDSEVDFFRGLGFERLITAAEKHNQLKEVGEVLLEQTQKHNAEIMLLDFLDFNEKYEPVRTALGVQYESFKRQAKEKYVE